MHDEMCGILRIQKKKRKMYDNRAIEEWVKGKIEVAEK